MPVDILVVDDASTDPAVDGVLRLAATYDARLRVLRNAANLGYTATANRGLRETPGDVLLLNSDTVVTPRWLESMLAAAYRRPRIGTVTAMSDNAGAFSVPARGRRNRLPASLDSGQLGRVIANASPGWMPSVPTGHGFCLLIKRRLVEDIGGFDDQVFARGYGEENDFCMRGRRRGWEHVIDDRTLVLHEGSASFGAEAPPLLTAAADRLAQRYPDYGHLVRVFSRSPLLRQARAAAAAALHQVVQVPPGECVPQAAAPRVLTLLHDLGEGGVAHTSLDLIRELATEFACLVLVVQAADVRLWAFQDAELVLAGHWTLNQAPELFGDQPADYCALLGEILVRQRIELLHIRHLLHHALEAPSVARSLNIPVVLSFHDFYAVCPVVTLLDEAGQYCAGHCTPGAGDCTAAMPWPDELPPLKHGMIHEWRRRVRAQLAAVDACVTTSEDTARLLTDHYPEITGRLQIIEHGRSFPTQHLLAEPPVPGQAIRILVLGHLGSRHKGAEVVKRLHELDTERRLEFHFLGQVGGEYRSLGQCHGPYRRDDLPRAIGLVRPSFVLLPAIWPETYSHTLSEAWACGVPVIGPALGAIGERIKRHGGGWLVPAADAEAILRLLLRLAADPAGYAAEAARARLANIRSAAEMGQDYRVLYKTLLARQAHAARGQPGEPTPILRVAVVGDASGTQAAAPEGSGWRWLQPLRHPRVAERLDVAVIPAAALARWSAGSRGRVAVVSTQGDDTFAALLQGARQCGLTIVGDAGLPPVRLMDGSPVRRLRAGSDLLVGAEDDPLETHIGLLDERPWLWLSDRRAAKDALQPSSRPHLVVMPGGNGDAIARLVAAAATGAWQVTWLSAAAPADLPPCIAVLTLPAAATPGALAVWLDQALPDAVTLAALPGSGGAEIGPLHWGLLGVPCLLAAGHPEAATLGLETLPDAAASWTARLAEIAEDPARLDGKRLCDAVLNERSLRHRADALFNWLQISLEEIGVNTSAPASASVQPL
jgi:hypothetical protein